MALLSIREGRSFRICAWEEGGFCRLLEFLNDLKENHFNDYKRLWALFERTAEQGAPQNPCQCKELKGNLAEGLFEFKTPGGARVIWFYDRNQLIICTHGFIKKKQKTPAREISRAQRIRREYFARGSSRIN